MPRRVVNSAPARVGSASTAEVRPAPVPTAPSRPSSIRRPASDGFAPTPIATSALVAVSRSGELSVNGKTGNDAMVSLARIIENGQNPLRDLKAQDLASLYTSLSKTLSSQEAGKPTAARVSERSAAATVLLQAATSAPTELRDRMLNTYADAMVKEKSVGLRTSMMVNLDASRLSLNGPALAKATQTREALLPPRPPYEAWLKDGKLSVKHYVMDEFWRNEVAAYKQRGFTLVEGGHSKDTAVFEKVMKDPKGGKDIKARVEMTKSNDDIFRDMKDKSVDMIVYSGHAQLGGVVETALATAPKEEAGTKLIQLYSCRGKQTAGEILEKYPGAHVTTTASSAYGTDDKEVLNATYAMIENRGNYADAYKALKPDELLQPRSNYIFPNDARLLASRDTDNDGTKDLTALGADKFFDPSKRAAVGGKTDLKPRAVRTDPQELSGDKVDHAVSYANTAFFYFSEENRKSPLTMKQADHFVPNGWFKSDGDEVLKITPKKKDGETYYEMQINSKYSGQSQEALAAVVLMESQKYLCENKNGKYTQDDQLRGVLLAGSYVDLFCKYAEDCNSILGALGEKYGLANMKYEVLFEAGKREGHHTGAQAAVDYLIRHGVGPIGTPENIS
jgi:hypothetical protein